MEIISKRSRYALHGVGYIAAFGDDRSVPFDAILGYLEAYSGRLGLSPGYIAKIFQSLSKAGLVVAVPGPRGGYRLARNPEQIRLVEVIEALDGPILSGCCLLSVGTCQVEGHCGVGGILQRAEGALYRVFDETTVAEMVRRMAFPAGVELEGRVARKL